MLRHADCDGNLVRAKLEERNIGVRVCACVSTRVCLGMCGCCRVGVGCACGRVSESAVCGMALKLAPR